MYRFTDETLYLSMNYIYRYTKSVCRVQSKMLELIILTAMYIAGKVLYTLSYIYIIKRKSV